MRAVSLAIVGVAAAQNPDQPHLAQAWIAKSTGDGLPGAVGDEAYLVVDNEAHHLWDYGTDGQKLWTCPKGNPSCVAYYLKLNGPNCCKCDQNIGKPKPWDIPESGFLTKVNFVAYEDTTELYDHQVKGAEHWYESTGIPQVVSITYDYFLHREDSGDVVSHRIDFDTTVQQSGSILYGNFSVQHDIDAHRQKFAVPEVCKGNILNCCPDMDKIDAKWFKHDYALRQVKKKAEAAIAV